MSFIYIFGYCSLAASRPINHSLALDRTLQSLEHTFAASALQQHPAKKDNKCQCRHFKVKATHYKWFRWAIFARYWELIRLFTLLFVRTLFSEVSFIYHAFSARMCSMCVGCPPFRHVAVCTRKDAVRARPVNRNHYSVNLTFTAYEFY